MSKGSIYNDRHSLDAIRKQGQVDQRSAIKAAAKEFESFFMNMMLKSMRQASEVIGDDSMFSSSQEKMFVGMLDEQMSVELSQSGNLGIAELMTRDLLGESKIHKAETFFKNTNPLIGSVNKKASQVEQDLGNKSFDNVDMRHVAPQSTIMNKPNDKEKQTVDGVFPTTKVKTINQNINGASEKKSLFEDATDFIKSLMPAAIKVAGDIGMDPKLLVAQAALETGWGKYIMHDKSGTPSFNLFGIKGGASWSGNSVKIDSLEVENGTFVKRKDDFRMYGSFEKSFEDYVEFLTSKPRYQGALEFVEDSKKFMQELQESGYATDPNYAKKILRIFENDIKLNQLFK